MGGDSLEKDGSGKKYHNWNRSSCVSLLQMHDHSTGPISRMTSVKKTLIKFDLSMKSIAIHAWRWLFEVIGCCFSSLELSEDSWSSASMGASGSREKFDPTNQSLALDPSTIRYRDVPYRFSEDSSIKTMNLTGNRIEKLPRKLHSLKTLILEDNDIQCLTAQMEKALLSYPALECLDLANNHITLMPAVLGKLPSLKELILSNNDCVVFDCEHLPKSLESLNLAQNRVTQLPKALPESLQLLNVSYNLLECLDIENPYLNGVYASMNRISTLRVMARGLLSLDVSRNHLTQLPDLAEATPSLTNLDASINELTAFPVLPITMKRIVLSNNKIEVIDSLCQFEQLAELDISSNCVRVLPRLPSSVTSLHVHKNKLELVEDSECRRISQFLMMRNALKEIPKVCAYVSDVFLMRNQIEMIQLENVCQNIVALRLSENNLTEIPAALFSLPHLEHLSLFGNKIVRIPSEIASSKLTVLNIGENPIEELNCCLPATLTKLVCSYCTLKSLDCLEGHAVLTELCAYGNELSSLPELPALTRALLGQNKFESFPSFSASIRVIDMSCNNISSIGAELKYEHLQELDLSRNNLSSFPAVFDCQAIESLKVAHNPLAHKFNVMSMPKLVNIDISATRCEIQGEPPDSLREIMISDADVCTCALYKHIESCQWASFCELKGMRPTMEDAVVFQPSFNDSMSIFAVCDGHGGSATAHFCARAICLAFRDLHEFSESAVTACIESIVSDVKQQNFKDGTTLSMILLAKETREIISVNIGDSRTVLLSDTGDVRFATKDHKPNDRNELERILTGHGKVIGQRVDGQLAVARTIGDFHVHGVSHEPTVTRLSLLPSDKWILIGCDGVFDVFSNSQIGQIGAKLDDPIEFAYRVRNSAYSRVSPDNISVITINLKMQ